MTQQRTATCKEGSARHIILKVSRRPHDLDEGQEVREKKRRQGPPGRGGCRGKGQDRKCKEQEPRPHTLLGGGDPLAAYSVRPCTLHFPEKIHKQSSSEVEPVRGQDALTGSLGCCHASESCQGQQPVRGGWVA